jgi:hypothetical protein
MDWIYVEDELPKSKQALLVCLVSVRNMHDEKYVTFASYQEDMGVWVDSDMEQVEVYAWCLPVPAKERN